MNHRWSLIRIIHKLIAFTEISVTSSHPMLCVLAIPIIMAKIIVGNYLEKSKKKRPGVHAKSKSSKLKNSKNYVKAYRGQGK